MKIYVPGKVIDVKKPKCISWLNLNVFFFIVVHFNSNSYTVG